MIIYEEGATPWMRDMAHDILTLLTTVYPGYPWAVNVYGDEKGGGYFIRNLDFPANYGMNQPKAHRFGSISELRADVLRKAGELLERCGLVRGRNNDEPIKMMEGVPDKWQPPEYREEKYIKNLVVVANELRNEALPQVEREASRGD
jgi:hypothetical protein